MRAAIYKSYGPPDILKIENVQKASIQGADGDQVLVRSQPRIATLKMEMPKAKSLSKFKMGNVYQETSRTRGFTSQTCK